MSWQMIAITNSISGIGYLAIGMMLAISSSLRKEKRRMSQASTMTKKEEATLPHPE